MFDLTHLGHAGWMVQDRNFKAIFDPWLSPKGTFFNSWHQFPDNSHMISDTLFKNLDFIYISHAHKDHYDPWTLHLVDKTTPILIPEFKDKTLRQNLQKLGFTKIEELLEEETFAIKGVKAQVIIEEGFNDRDSAIILCNESNKIINLNDCHPSFEKIKKYSENVDLLLLQSSSAIWWPCVYDYNFSDLISKCKLKRNNVLNRTLQYAKCIKPKFVVPNAGPPVFLHDQFRFWDETRDESFNPFLLLDDVNRFLKKEKIPSLFIIPGSKISIQKDKIINHTDAKKREQIYSNVQKEIDKLRIVKTHNGNLGDNLLPSGRDTSQLSNKFSLLIKKIRQKSKIFIHKINFPILIDFKNHSKWIIDFTLEPDNCFLEFTNQDYSYGFEFDPQIVDYLISKERIDFDEYFLSMRFKCTRKEDVYNEFLFAMFKNLDLRSFMLSENIYMTNNINNKNYSETFIAKVGKSMKRIQKFCPHKGVNLEKCGIIENGHITCPLHNWKFDLQSGRCLTSDKYKLTIQEME